PSQACRASIGHSVSKRIRDTILYRIIGQVQLQRRYRDPVVFQRMNVGSLPEMPKAFAEKQPVVGKPASVEARVDRQAEIQLALGGDVNALNLLRRAFRKVEVQEGAVRQINVAELADEVGRIGLGHFPR